MTSRNLTIIYGYKNGRNEQKLFVTEKNFESTIFQTAQYSPKILSEIQNSKLGETDFLELFKYQNISLYWFMYPTFWSQLNNSTKFIDRFLEFIEKVEPSEFYLENDFTKYDLLKQICFQKNIRFTFSKKNFLKYKLRKKLTPLIRKINLNKITKLKIKSRIQLYNDKYSTLPSLDKKVIFASSDVYRRNLINIKKSITEEGEFFIDDLLDIIPNSFSTLGIALDYDVHGNISKLKRRLNSELHWVPAESFLKQDFNEKEKTEFFIRFKKLLKNKNFQSLFSYNGISLWSQLEFTFHQMTFEPYFPFWIQLIDSLTTAFQKSKPTAIFLPYETGPLALCFIEAGKQSGVPTIGIQHGVIADNWKFYSINPLESQHPFGFPLPSKILLFGDFSKRILLKNKYPAEKLISFGNPLFFNLGKKSEVLKKMDIKKIHHIPEEKKIILFPTISLQKFQSWSESNHNTEIWDYLLSHYGGNEQFFLILKPHPDEDPKIYETMAEKYNASNVLITKESLYELVYISKIVVSMFSTAIIDSLCFQKPVIQIEFATDDKSPIPFGDLGVTLTTDLENLSEKISQVLFDESNLSKITANRKDFLKDLYGIPEENYPSIILEKILSFTSK